MSLLHFETDDGAFDFEPTRLVIAGWTGRDAAAIEHHIEELERLGVPRPSQVPLYYRGSASLPTQGPSIDVVGAETSGEAEPVLLRHRGQWYLTVGSDHTDRAAETMSVALSKQLCPKPVARRAWRWDLSSSTAGGGGADALRLVSEIEEGGAWITYQSGTLAQIRPLPALVDGLPGDVSVHDGLMLFCGTVPAIAQGDGPAIRPAMRMRVAIQDAARSRRLVHEYAVTVLPHVS